MAFFIFGYIAFQRRFNGKQIKNIASQFRNDRVSDLGETRMGLRSPQLSALAVRYVLDQFSEKNGAKAMTATISPVVILCDTAAGSESLYIGGGLAEFFTRITTRSLPG